MTESVQSFNFTRETATSTLLLQDSASGSHVAPVTFFADLPQAPNLSSPLKWLPDPRVYVNLDRSLCRRNSNCTVKIGIFQPAWSGLYHSNNGSAVTNVI